jgi:hypothetical protein
MRMLAGLAVAFLALAWRAAADAPPAPKEQAITRIPLTGLLAERRAELSGLDWYGDRLVLLPQYPPGKLFAIPRPQILAFLDGKSTAPITAEAIVLDTGGVEEKVPGFNGFEAIAFRGNRAYLAIEAAVNCKMSAWLVAGDMAPDGASLRLDPATLTAVPLDRQICNMGIETLVLVGDRLLAVFEANGANVAPHPVAWAFNTDLKLEGAIPIPSIEYRITDATKTDAQGRFWVTNYLWPGDIEKLRPAKDALRERFGAGPSHAKLEIVERLVQLQYRDGRISLTDTPPIQLALAPPEGRNWEGIVRLDDRGFLVVTDEYPETLFAFVPRPEIVARLR